MQKKRTPENFPKMKVRGGKRRHYKRSSQIKNTTAFIGKVFEDGTKMLIKSFDRTIFEVTKLFNVINSTFKDLEVVETTNKIESK